MGKRTVNTSLSGPLEYFACICNREDPHVVFLQEVVGASQDILEDEFPMYHMVPSNTEGYFTMMMLKTGHVQVEESKIYEYPTSMMMRNLLSVKVIGLTLSHIQQFCNR